MRISVVLVLFLELLFVPSIGQCLCCSLGLPVPLRSSYFFFQVCVRVRWRGERACLGTLYVGFDGPSLLLALLPRHLGLFFFCFE